MYKVTIYERIEYPNNGQVLLDTSSGGNSGITDAKYEGTLNEAGSFTFSIVPSHPLYDSLEPLYTYIKVEEDGTEIFYGRVLMIKTNRITGVKQVTCEGALAFLLDIEMGEDDDETTYAAGGYFRQCLDVYNQRIREDDYLNKDLARELHLGNVTIPEAAATDDYKNGSRTQVQSVMKSKLLNVYDGFFRIRPDGTKHYLDWVSQVGVTNPQPIRIKQNVVSHSTTESGEDIFTLMWPKGNSSSSSDDDEDDGDIEISPIALSVGMVHKYGIIIRTVNFDADDTTTLRNKAMERINKIQDRLSQSGEVNFVDMSYLDGSHPKVHLGDVFTNIDGFEGIKLTASSVSRDLFNPANDKLTLKTDKDLMSSSGSNGTNSSSSSSGSSSSSLSSTGSKWYKFIHETETDLSLAAKNIEITAEEKIKVLATTVETHAESIATLSTDMGTQKGKWTAFEGTALYQNRNSIATVAGKFQTDNYGRLVLAQGTEFIVSGDGTSTNVGKILVMKDNTVRDVGQLLVSYAGSYTYQHDNEIAGIVGRYTVETYQDPTTPWKEITPIEGANPKELGYYEYSNGSYVKTNDETVVSGKKYYVSNDIQKVTFDSGGGYKIKENGVEYGLYTKEGDNAVLTAGLIVDMVNGQTVSKLKGSLVVIGNDVDIDPDYRSKTLDGTLTVITSDFTSVNNLLARKIEASYITSELIKTRVEEISGVLSVSQLQVTNSMSLSSGATLVVPASSGGISVASSALTISSGSGEGTVSIHPNEFLKEVQVVATGNVGEYKLQYKTAFASSWTDAGTFSKAATSSKVTGTWSGGTYTVSENNNGQSLPISDTVYLTIEGSPNPNATAYAKAYHTNPSVNENQIGSTEMTLSENASAKTVRLIVNTLTKATVSTQQTYDSGWDASIGDITVSAPESKTLSYGEEVTVTAKATKSNGSEQYVVARTYTAPADRYSTGYNAATASYTKANGTLTVSKTTGGTAFPISFAIDASIIYNSTTHKYTAKALCDDDQMDSAESGTEAYNAGWAAAYGKVTIPSTSSSNDYCQVKTPPSTVDGPAVTTNFFLDASSNNVAYIRVGNATTGTTVATVTHNKFSSGYSAGRTDYEPDSITQNTSAKTITVLNGSGDSVGGPYSVATTYNAGWNTALSNITVNVPTGKTLEYDEEISVSVKVQKTDGSEEYKAAQTYTAPSDRYDTGFDAVSNPSFDHWATASASEPSSNVIENTVTFKTSNKTNGDTRTGTRRIVMLGGTTWTSGATSITVQDSNTSGNYILKKSISMPSSATWSAAVDTTTSGKEYKQYKVYCTAGGKQYGAYTLGTAASWDHGGQTAHMSYARVDSRDGTYTTLDMATYGQGYTYVRIQGGYVNSSGTRTSQSNSITIGSTTYYGKIYLKVPQFQSKTVTSNGTVYPDSGYAGLSSVTVNVSAESHSFWGYVGLYQSSITIEGETYSLYAYSQSKQTYTTTRVYK